MRTIVAASTLMAALAAWSAPAAAQAEGPGPLLDLTLHGQLERWLGAGPLQLDELYTRGLGDDSLDFHAAVDGRGDTFTLISVIAPDGMRYLVGGYNPQSWSSTDGWHETPFDWQRTAFLFNYTAPAVYRQVPTSYILPSQGLFQTFNQAEHGPTFGAGPDLLVDGELDTLVSWQVSYGDPANQGMSIVDRSLGGQFMRVEALEMYAVTVIPEPGMGAMLAGGLGLLGLAGAGRRCARRRGATPGAA